jgi:pterin-4a-carbinolamine dehydratase
MDVGNLIFLSYRRSDTAPQTLALKLELESRLRAAQLFLDTRSIQGGDIWPEQIQDALKATKAVIAIIGKDWAGSADGARRIDDPADWVYRELSFTLTQKKAALIPVLVDGATFPASLPAPLDQLATIQAMPLQVANWDASVGALVDILKEKFAFEEKQSRFKFPIPNITVQRTIPYPWTDLESVVLDELKPWRVEFSDDPDKLNYKRVELARDFEFRSFEQAMEFMQRVARHASEVDHHPRWMNLWRTVTVWLSTWDAGHRITVLDVNFAKYVERAYKQVRGNS